MAKRAKKAKKQTTRRTSRAAASSFRAMTGRGARGAEWDPTQPQAQAAAMYEVNEPRPYASRYPIPEEHFRALKERAARARLGRVTAERARDSSRRKVELSALAAAPAALAPGLEPVAAPTGSTNFAGIPMTGWIPPDCTMAVGPSHVLLSVNSSLAIYDKNGTVAMPARTLTQWFANVVTGMTIFDPKALYDQYAGRWVLVAVAVQNTPKASLHLLSVSQTANPLGPWRNYKFNAMLDGTTATNNWADYPSLGVDNLALYITTNMFAFGGNFQYAKIRVIPKAGPYSGGTAPYHDFVGLKNADNTMAFTIQPCHTFNAPGAEYLVNTAFPSGNFLTLWEITNPTAATPTLTRKQVTISPYNVGPNADQQGGAPPLNTGDVRVMHAVYRGDLWTSFTTAHNWGGALNRCAIEWCQIRMGVQPSVVQQGVYGAGNAHYFYPALCPDNNGNVTMVFSRCSPSEFGSVLYTGRRSTDAPGTLQASAFLKAGVAHYSKLDTSNRNRWGDYAGVAADPVNPRLIWFYSEFASAVDTWGTWVGSSFF
jgi:hypothetical protein